MVNITRFSSDNFEEGTAFVPVFPDSGEAMEGVELWIKSSNSNVAIPLITRITNKAAAHQAQLQRTGKSSIDLADSVKDDIDLACAVLVSFKGFTDGDGKEIESSPEMIKELMTKHAWLRAQVLSKANDATFLQERVDDLRESVRSVFEFYYKPQFKTSSGKITKYEHLKRASRATGKVLAELENPPTVLPEFIHIWKWFTDLSRTRSSGFQVEPLTHPMMRAYFDLMLIRASPIEIDVLTIIDDEYLALTRAVAGEKNG